MKKIFALMLAAITVLSLCGCVDKGVEKVRLEELNALAVETVGIVDDHLASELSYNGAEEKLDDINYKLELYYAEYTLNDLYSGISDVCLQFSFGDPVSLLMARDRLAVACGMSEVFGTSKAEDAISDINKTLSSHYDIMINETINEDTAIVKLSTTRAQKGAPAITKIYIFFFASVENTVRSVLAAASAWGHDRGTFDIEVFYNGVPIAVLEFNDPDKNKAIGDCDWDDNLLSNVTNVSYTTEDETLKSWLNPSGFTQDPELTKDIFENFTSQTYDPSV